MKILGDVAQNLQNPFTPSSFLTAIAMAEVHISKILMILSNVPLYILNSILHHPVCGSHVSQPPSNESIEAIPL